MANTVFGKVDKAFLAKLAEVVPAERILTTGLEAYSHDWTEDLRYPPEVVVKPETTAEVAGIAKLCNENTVPLTVAGGRTGLSGGMLPVKGGLVLSTERMNKIVQLDTRNQQIRVQPGVITQNIHEAAAEHNLMYAPDPSSSGSCFIGGNLAENAGGAHAVKYGITNQHVLALEAVLATGEIIKTGANVLKNSTGYNLTQLLVGSEGTLAIITEATLKLLPKPKHARTMLAPFADAEKACAAVSKIFNAGLQPSTLEFMERDAIAFAQDYLNSHPFDLAGVAAHLLIEFDGRDEQALFAECAECVELLEAHGASEVLFAESASQQQELWRVRKIIGEAVKSGGNIYKEEDTVVPRAELAKLLHKVKALGEQYGFRSVCYGHAGDGNLHVNILRDTIPQEKWETMLPVAIRQLFEFTVSLGGTLSGEHGIGWVQRNYMDIAFSPLELQLMKGIKQLFDPKGILNPGKIFPDEA